VAAVEQRPIGGDLNRDLDSARLNVDSKRCVLLRRHLGDAGEAFVRLQLLAVAEQRRV